MMKNRRVFRTDEDALISVSADHVWKSKGIRRLFEHGLTTNQYWELDFEESDRLDKLIFGD